MYPSIDDETSAAISPQILFNIEQRFIPHSDCKDKHYFQIDKIFCKLFFKKETNG